MRKSIAIIAALGTLALTSPGPAVAQSRSPSLAHFFASEQILPPTYLWVAEKAMIGDSGKSKKAAKGMIGDSGKSNKATKGVIGDSGKSNKATKGVIGDYGKMKNPAKK